MKKSDLSVGDLIAFQIGEREDFSAANKDRWGVVKILDLGKKRDNSLSISVKSGLWDQKPDEAEACVSPILTEKRYAKLGNGSGARHMILTAIYDDDINLLNAVVIGRDPSFAPAEEEAVKDIQRLGYLGRISGICSVAMFIDHEYRAEHDEAQWKVEIQAYSDKQDRLRKERYERERQRLSKLTLQILQEETQFVDWDNRTQIVPAEFTNAVRQRSGQIIEDLVALGAKPPRKEVRAVLKQYVEWLNRFDGSFNYEIETVEREDLMGFVEELCWAVKQKPLIEEANAWRDW